MVPKPEERAQIGRSLAAEEGGCYRPVLILVPMALDESQGDQGICQERTQGQAIPVSAASLSRGAGSSASAVNSPISFAINRCLAAIKPVANWKIGPG
jgi:hypothetical protein